MSYIIYPETKKVLTEDDKKIIKHLNTIDNLFKKGNTSIRFFNEPGHVLVTTVIDDLEYEITSFSNIPQDGGDPDTSANHSGLGVIYSADELEELLEERNDQ